MNKIFENMNNQEEIKNINDESSLNNAEAAPENELEKKTMQIEKEAAEYKDKYIRKVAEFDNFKRRKDHELMEFFKYANEDLIRELLPVLDDLERSLSFVNDENNNKNLCEGVTLIYNKFVKVLNNFGLTAIEAVNKPFDVHYHDAVMQVDRPDLPPHTVVEEVIKGYCLKDKVVRHTKVLVSSDNSENTNS